MSSDRANKYLTTQASYMPRLLLSFCFMVFGAILLNISTPGDATAIDLSCPAEHQITVDFENRSAWGFCWDAKQRENIVLSDIHYRNTSGTEMPVISSIRLSQLHVAYDDNNVTYNDVTQFGLGGGYSSTLTELDCPQGTLINTNGRAGLCKEIYSESEAFRTQGASNDKQVLKLFSTSHVGAYSYLVTWLFYDDGSIEPSVGASGALQRSGDHSHAEHGRELEESDDTIWLSHTHNYYWRIDFDIGQSANDDVVSEVSYSTDDLGRRERHTKRLTVEAAREIDRESMRSWYITDSNEPNEQNKPNDITGSKGYLIEPKHYGHKLVRENIEPFTEFDFFVTRQNDCERFSSENKRFNPECGDDLLDFVNDESLLNEDIVVWHRISFHHVPRNEDRSHMHSHWDGFLMKARNLNTSTPGQTRFDDLSDNNAPSVNIPAQLQHTRGDTIDITLNTDNVNGESINYKATGLPPGVTLSSNGTLQGIVNTGGNYEVKVFATNRQLTSGTTINWQVVGPVTTGSFGLLISWFLIFLILQRALYRHRSSTN